MDFLEEESEEVTLNVDPDVIGPGYWSQIHLKAKEATTPEEKQRYVEYMNWLAKVFPCKKCRKHIAEYLQKHPLSKYERVIDREGRDVGYFAWSVRFHNVVNLRLNKPRVTYERAFQMYYLGDESCVSGCGMKGETDEPGKLEKEQSEEVFEVPNPNIIPTKGSRGARKKFARLSRV